MKGHWIFMLIICVSAMLLATTAQHHVQPVISHDFVRKEVDRTMTDYDSENFIDPHNVETSGWWMRLPSGREVSRSFLQSQARPIVQLYGKNAVPHLFVWIRHENCGVRYIAIHALNQITGLYPEIPDLGKSDNDFVEQRAIDTWREWYEAQ
jgi:hypothetical protein